MKTNKFRMSSCILNLDPDIVVQHEFNMNSSMEDA